jgi:hypothetical protein
MLSRNISIADKSLDIYAGVLLSQEDAVVTLGALQWQLKTNHIETTIAQQYYIRALCKATHTDGSFSKADVLFEDLRRRGTRLGAGVYSDFLQCAARTSGLAQTVLLVDLLVEIASADPRLCTQLGVQPWNDLLAALKRNCCQDSLVHAMDLFDQMTSLGVEVNAETFETIIVMCSALGEYQQASALYTKLPSDIEPTFETTRCLVIDVMRSNRSAVRAESLFRGLIDKPAYVYRSLGLLKEMIDLGYVFTFEIFKEFLRALSTVPNQRGSAEVAINLFKISDQMRSPAVVADLECFQYLFKTFERSLSLSHADNAWNALSYMRALDVTPSLQIYESLLRTWVNSRR